MEKSNSIAKNVTMYSEQWEVVEAVDKRFGFHNTSSALRYIVSEYQRMMNETSAQKPASAEENE